MKFRPCTWISRWLRLSNLHKSWFAQEFEMSDFLNSLGSGNTSFMSNKINTPLLLKDNTEASFCLAIQVAPLSGFTATFRAGHQSHTKVKSQCNRARELLSLSRKSTMNRRHCRTQTMCTGKYKGKRHWELEYGKWKANLHKRVFIDTELLS